MKFRVNVTVTLKDGVLDPQGLTIGHALNDLGFETVSSVKTGKLFFLEIDADTEEGAAKIAEDAASKLLANPIIEVFKIEVER